MTNKEKDKKRLYINIALLIVVFIISAFFFFPKIFPNFSKNPQDINKASSTTFVKKYNNIKSIETDIFTDERFKSLKYPTIDTYLKPMLGNLEPFTSK